MQAEISSVNATDVTKSCDLLGMQTVIFRPEFTHATGAAVGVQHRMADANGDSSFPL